MLSAALSVYSTSTNLAGTNVHGTDSHFNTSPAGSGMDTYSVGANGAAFGLANSTTLTVMQLLTDLNAGTSAGAAVASGANTVFSGINTAGNVTNADLSDFGLAYTPAQIRTAYGINNLSLDGTRPNHRHRRRLRRSGHRPVAGRIRQPVRANLVRSDALSAVRPGLVVPDGSQSERPDHFPARHGPQRPRHRQLGTRGGGGRGMGARHGARGPDRPGRSQ